MFDVKGSILVGLSVCLLALAGTASAAIVTYDFDGLTTGNLVGQDNWALYSGTGSPRVGAYAPVWNTTKVFEWAGNGPVQRLNDSNFAYRVPTTDTAWTFQVDFEYGSGTTMGLWYDADGNGLFDNSAAELGCKIWLSNIATIYDGLSVGNIGSDTYQIMKSDGINMYDWLSLKVVVNFPADTWSASVRRLSTNAGGAPFDWIPLTYSNGTAMTDLALNSAFKTWANNATDVNKLGIYVSTGGGNSPGFYELDNIAITPEPASLVLLAAGGVLMGLRRRRG